MKPATVAMWQCLRREEKGEIAGMDELVEWREATRKRESKQRCIMRQPDARISDSDPDPDPALHQLMEYLRQPTA